MTGKRSCPTVIVWKSSMAIEIVSALFPTIHTENFHSVGAMILVSIYRPLGVPFNLTPACCRWWSERHLSSCSKPPSTHQCWSMERRSPSWKRGYRHRSFGVQFPPFTAFKESLSLVNCFKSLLSSCLYFTTCSCDNSWYDNSASDSLREFGQILWKNHFQSPPGFDDGLLHGRDKCQTMLDNGTLNRTASDSSLFRRSSARHLKRLVACVAVVAVVVLLLRYNAREWRRFSLTRSGLVVGHPQPSWRTKHPCTVDVLPGPTGVTSSPRWDEIKAPTLLVFWLGRSVRR